MAYHANVQQQHVAEHHQIRARAKQQNNKKAPIQNSEVIPANPLTKNSEKKSIVQAKYAINLHTFSKSLARISSRTSSQKCAKSIRLALESAGARFDNHPVAASDWGKTLMDIGYRRINPAFDHPERGDIYIIQRTKAHVYGHIAGFSGAEWVSDFKQSSHVVYKENVTYSYYRLGS